MFMKTNLLLIFMLACLSVFAQQLVEIKHSYDENPIKLTVKSIKDANESIQAVVYKFEVKKIFEALVKAHERGVEIKLLVDAKEAKKKKSFAKKARNLGIKVQKWKSGKLHAKFAIIDNKKVITGSFNWTESAKEENLELIIIEKIPEVTLKFTALFNDLWKKATQE